jgi:hypothetical protein
MDSAVSASGEPGNVSATVNRVLASPPAPVETGFGELDGTPSPIQAAPTINAEADTGTPEDPEDDLDGRVAGLLANRSATNWFAVSAFMADVVAWPGPNDPGHIGLYYRSPNPNYDPKQKPSFKNKPDYLTGWPFRDVDAFVAAAGRTQNAPERYQHIYFCTSRQAKQGLNKRGIAKAMRNAADALYQKSIWIDIDVGPNNPKKYATHEEAWQEFSTLRKTLGLPTHLPWSIPAAGSISTGSARRPCCHRSGTHTPTA